jgi:2,3-diketo-5-methylthio-1-phosphopentane phosphatase
MTDKSFKIFVDFDGTITKIDVGENLFLKFGQKEQNQYLIDNWNSEQFDALNGWRSLCSSVGIADIQKMEAYLDTIEIDPGFHDFIKFCETNEMPVKIISDGFDFYIKRILDRENLGRLDFSSNILKFKGDMHLEPFFPNSQEDCKHCANCKRNFVLDNSGDDDYTVYIGNGQSDQCPIQYCDFIFAKDSLLKFCEINRITYFPFFNFNDVIERLEELKNKKRLKKRYQAELKRREVFIQG